MKGLLLAALVLGLDAVLTGALELQISPANDRNGIQFVTLEAGRILTCSALNTNNVDPAMNWRGPNGIVIGSNTDAFSRRVSRSGPNKLKLYFSPVKKGAEGTYTCSGRDSTGRVVSATTKLTIYEALSCDSCERDQFPVNGTDALISCPLKGSPPPEVSWKVKGRFVNFETEKARYTQTPEGMIVKAITERDNGIYICIGEVESMGSVLEHEIEVDVAFKPSFLGKPRITGNPIVRGEATLVCEAKGRPAPQVQFYKMNRPNTPVTGDRVKKDQYKGTMKISHLTSDDTGKYKCVASNRAGKAEVVFDFQVIEPPTLAELTNTTALKGLAGNLTCFVKGNPKPTLKFQKEGEAMPYTNNVVQGSDPRIRVREIQNDPLGRAGLQLMISKTTPKDSANYTCIAENTAGTYKFNGEMRIRFKPEMDKTEKTFYHWLGAVRNLTCLADAEPLPILFHWFHNGLKIDQENATYKIFNESKASWLQITTAKGDTNQEKWIFGQYSCNASNAAGSSSAVIDVKQAIAPERPQSANITLVTPTTVRIEATPPRDVGLGGIKLRGYQVNYKQLDEKVWEKQDFPITQKILVRNLVPNKQYQLKVLAYNAVGTSNVGINMDATTLKERKPYPVEIISDRTSTTSYKYMLEWEAPLSGGSAILSYKVNYRAVSEVNVADSSQRGASYSGAWHTVQVAGSDSASKFLKLEIVDLSENQSYEVYIEATNEHGTSDAPEPYFIFRTLTLTGRGEQKTATGTPKKSESIPAHMRGPFGNMSTAAVVGILIAIVFIILIAVDVAFYFTKECGVLNTICLHFCGKGGAGKGRESAMEEGVSFKNEKLQEEDSIDNKTPEPEANETMDQSDHGDEIEMDEKAPLTPGDGKNKNFPPPEETSPYHDETTPSAKATPDGSPKEHHPIIA